MPYSAHTTQIGSALGRPAAAAELVTGLARSFDAARAQNPTLVGKKAVCAEYWAPDFSVIGTAARRTQFLLDLGLTVPEAAC